MNRQKTLSPANVPAFSTVPTGGTAMQNVNTLYDMNEVV